jgi:hypothetical protein
MTLGRGDGQNSFGQECGHAGRACAQDGFVTARCQANVCRSGISGFFNLSTPSPCRTSGRCYRWSEKLAPCRQRQRTLASTPWPIVETDGQLHGLRGWSGFDGGGRLHHIQFDSRGRLRFHHAKRFPAGVVQRPSGAIPRHQTLAEDIEIRRLGGQALELLTPVRPGSGQYREVGLHRFERGTAIGITRQDFQDRNLQRHANASTPMGNRPIGTVTIICVVE